MSSMAFRGLLNNRGSSRPAGVLTDRERDNRMAELYMLVVDNNVLAVS